MSSEFKPQTEDLKHIADLQDFPSPPESINNSFVPSRQEILDFGDEGFLLEDVLSKEECQFYMDQGENQGFGLIHGVRESYRNSQR